MTRSSSAFARAKGHRRRIDPRSHRPNARTLRFESLEDRTLLSAQATLEISSSGALTYTGSTAVTDGLTVKTSTVITDGADGFSTLMYTFTSDSDETITLGPNATNDGWTGSGTSVVTGPGSIKQSTTTTIVSSVAIDLEAGDDSLTISSVGAKTSVNFNSNPGDADSVTLGGAGGAQNISGNVTLSNAAGTTALTVNDSGDTKAETVFVSGTQIANLEPSLIQFGSANLSSLRIIGAGALGTLNVNANDQGPVAVTGGSATGSGTITIGNSAPITYSNFLAVNVSNAADQPLTQVSQSITTSTGDTPTEGKSFTYLTATFADADPQAKTSSFVASINWGDGTPPTAGSLAADGVGQFQASGTHTYEHAGSYSVVTTITDLGTTDTLSLAGIAVTISDVGGGGLTTGSVAQVNLVSNNTTSIPANAADPELVNPWGIAGDSLGQAWVADAGSGVATFEGPGADLPEGTSVLIPSASGTGTGSPAGIVSNPTSSFPINGQATAYLYATLDGTISGWTGTFPATGSPTAVIAVNNSATGAAYTGLAIASSGSQERLYVANFHSDAVEVYNSSFQLVNEFTDPNVPAGYAPYNVRNLGGDLYVTFAKAGDTATAATAQLGDGFVDVFAPDGTLIQGLIKGAPLDAPWGLAMAPTGFGPFAGDLLVANEGDGQVDAFNPATGQFLGVFAGADGVPLSNGGLHGLFLTTAGPLVFTAGPDSGAEGLFGTFSPTPATVVVAPATLTASISNITAFVNQPFNGVVATFTDANIYAVAGDFTATVQWGDGKSDTSGDGKLTITQSDGPGSSFLVTGTHTYAKSTTGGPPDVLEITISEIGTTNTVFAQGTASVSESTLHATFASFSPVAGATYSGPVASFTNDKPDSPLENNPKADPNTFYTAIIDWGDEAALGLPPGTDTSTGTIIESASNAGSFIVAGTHTYAFPTTGQSPDVVTVTITKKSTDEAAVAAGNVAVADSLLYPDLEGPLPPATEGIAYTSAGNQPAVVAAFVDANPNVIAANFNGPADSATVINWGDGKSSVGIVVGVGGGVFDVVGSHTYASPTPAGVPNTVSVAVTDQWGGKTTITNTIAVLPARLTFINLALPLNPATPIREGQSFTSDVVIFTSPNVAATANEYTATINWGDATPSDAGTIKEDGSDVFHVSGTHTYLIPGTYVITVSVLVTGGVSFTNDPSSVTVLDGTLNYTVPNQPVTKYVSGATIMAPPPAAPAGQPLTIPLGTLVDNDPNSVSGLFSVSIDWGDGGAGGAPGAGAAADNVTGAVTPINLVPAPVGPTGQQYAVTGRHNYRRSGNFTVTVTITDSDGSTSTGTFAITVAGRPGVLGLVARALLGGDYITAGQSFTDQVGQFESDTPDATASDFAASINWCDGSSGRSGPDLTAGTIIQGASDPATGDPTFYVIGTHIYDEANGSSNPNYTFTVYVSTPGDAPESASNEALAYAPPLIAHSAPLSGTQDQPLSATTSGDTVVATFTDPELMSDPQGFAAGTQATIDWGDGNEDTGTVTFVGASSAGASSVGDAFEVTGMHTYSNITDVFEAYEVTVTIETPDGSSAVVNDLAYATVPVLTDPPIAVQATAGVPFTVPVATIHTTVGQDTAADFTATLTWGDGQTSGATLQSEGNGTFEVLGSHTYANTGSYTIGIILSDNHGNTVGDHTTATVVAPAAPPPLAVTGVQPLLNRRGLVSRLVVTFNEPVDADQVGQLSLYSLSTAGKRGSPAARGLAALRLRSAVYDAVDDSIVLTPSKPIALKARLQLRFAGQSIGVAAGSGWPSDGAGKAHHGSMAVVVHPHGVAKSIPAAPGSSRDGAPANPAAIDALLEQDQLSDLSTADLSRRSRLAAHPRV
jgi:uncharacterized protein (TIGR03118 family)